LYAFLDEEVDKLKQMCRLLVVKELCKWWGDLLEVKVESEEDVEDLPTIRYLIKVFPG